MTQSISNPTESSSTYLTSLFGDVTPFLNMHTVNGLAREIWEDYASFVQERWGMDWSTQDAIGYFGCYLFGAEFREHYTRAYATSVVQPIRNIFFSACVAAKHWRTLEDYDIEEPVLDYGCGVGFLLTWLKRMGYEDLTGLDTPGVTGSFAHDWLTSQGMKFTHELRDHYKTIVCLNVLEHFKDPMAELQKLQMHCDRLIANCDKSEDEAHIAPQEARDEVIAELRRTGSLYVPKE